MIEEIQEKKRTIPGLLLVSYIRKDALCLSFVLQEIINKFAYILFLKKHEKGTEVDQQSSNEYDNIVFKLSENRQHNLTIKSFGQI